MKIRKNLSVLNNRFLFLLVILTIFLFTFGGYFLGERLMLKDAQSEAASLAVSSGDFIVSEITRYELLPNMAQICSCIKDLLTEPNNESLIDRTNRNFEKLVNLSEAQVVYLMSTDGITLASSNWRSKKSFVGKNIAFDLISRMP